jgi:hypothetical protein
VVVSLPPDDDRPQVVISEFTEDEAKRSGAFHEAGHAVVGTVWGFNVTEARIYQVEMPGSAAGYGYTGGTSCGSSSVPWVVGRAHMAVAGDLAARLYLRDVGRFSAQTARTTDIHDRRDVERELSAGFGFEMHDGPVPVGTRGASWEVVCDQTDQILQAMWPQVRDVAEILHASGRVTGGHVRSIVAEAHVFLGLEDMARIAEGQTAPELADLAARARRIAAQSRSRAARTALDVPAQEQRPPSSLHRYDQQHRPPQGGRGIT